MADVPVERKRHLLLNSLSPVAVEALASTCRPTDASKFTAEELLAKLDIIYTKRSNKRAERANFFLLRQKPGETLVDFASKLRNQSVKCDYPDNVLDDQLCSAFTAGVESESTRRYLWSLPESSVEKFDSLFDFAMKYEATQADAKRSNNQPDVAAISSRGGFRGRFRGRGSRNFSSRGGRGGFRTGGRSGLQCFGCGSTNHLKADCPARNQTCNNCGKVGHFAKVCKAPKKRQNMRGQRRTNYIEENEYDVLHMGPITSSSMFVPLKLNGVPISVELDTGSSVTILSKTIWRKIGSPKLWPETSTLRSFTGHAVKLMGCTKITVQYKEVTTELEVLISDRQGSVLGRDWIKALKLNQVRLKDLQQNSIHKVSDALTLNEILNEHKTVFRDELGCCKEFKAHLYLKEGSRPTFCKARSVPFALMPEVEAELNKLVQDGVLSPVDFSD